MQRDLIRKTWSRIGYEWASMVRDGRGFRLTLFPKGFIEMSSAELWSKSAQGGLQWSSMTGEAIKYWLHRARSSQGEFFLFHRSGGASGRDERVRKRKREREREREREKRVGLDETTSSSILTKPRVLYERHEHYSCCSELWRGICYQARISHLFMHFSSSVVKRLSNRRAQWSSCE